MSNYPVKRVNTGLRLGLLLAALASLGATGVGPGNSGIASAAEMNLPANTLRVQRVEIMDHQGFERAMPAATALIPVGWRTEGGIVWTIGGCIAHNVNWSATSPDGNRGIALFPNEAWNWSNFPSGGGNCPTAQITSIKQYLENLVSRARPGARVIDFRTREDLAQRLQQLNKVMPMPGGEMRTWVEAGEILIAYTNQNGVDIRETASAVVIFNLNRTATITGAVMETLVGQALNGFAVYAPSGQLDFKASELLRKAIRTAPEWSARISKSDALIAKDTADTYAQISADNIKGARERREIAAETSRYISDTQKAAWEYRSAMNDELQRKESDVLAGVETYVDPNSNNGEVKLTYNYKNAWRLDDGTYVLTDDLMFEPYKNTGQYGTKLEVKK